MVMHVELQATCSALGYFEGSHYIKEPDCLETVKELIRFLRREDDTCDIRRQLGHAQILQKDLLPLVTQHDDDKPLFDTVIRLLVNLTQPVLVCFNNQLPDEKTLRQHCLQIESHLQQYKQAFANEELFTVLTKKMTDLLKLDWEHRHEEDKLMLERLLVLVRNVLHIPPDPATEQRTDDDASLHDQILWAIHVSGMEDLLLYIASSENERQLCMHILEIVSLMFREQSPEILAFAGVQRSMSEKEKDERELEMARAKEKAQKKTSMLRFNTRHSNFGGTYVMMNTKSLSDRELIYHKSVQDADNFTLDTSKKPRKKPRNRQPIKDTPVIRRSTLSIRLGLKEFCIQFLENAYNPLMYAVKDNLVREATQELDETYYLWSMQFFMEFCRHHSGHIDFVSETMSVPTFHYIYNNLLRYYEMIMVERKEAVAWGRRVHLALRSYQELLMTLDSMDKSTNNHLRNSARVIKSNVFYMMEFRDIFITLLKKFNESKNSRAYLKDLVETTHLFLRMLEKYTKGSSHLVVKGKNRKRKKKAKKNKAARKNDAPSEQQLEDDWQEMSSELSDLLQGRQELPQDIAPFDAASEVEVDQQRADAMVRIHTALRQKHAGEAVAVFRAAREVWPERNEFGSQTITAEEEFMALREIYLAPLPGGQPAAEEQPEETTPMEEEEYEGEEEESVRQFDWEQEFNFLEYVKGYAKPEILKAYVTLGADFETNTTHTNHCVVKMLHRVGFDLGFVAMLFQASLFRVIQRIMLSPAAKTTKLQEFYKLGIHVMRRFADVAQKNKKVFMELMFWKTSKEALQITEGYDYNPSSAKVAWTEDDENELMRLFEDFRDAENPEKDTVDLILEQWSGQSKTRGQMIRQLKVMRLIDSVKDLRKKPEFTRAWTEDDEQELEQAFEEHRNSDDPLSNIIAALSKKRSRNKVIEKLLALGLVTDRKQLHKRRGKGRAKRRRRGLGSDDEANSDRDAEREDLERRLDDADSPMEDNLPSDEDILSSPSISGSSDGGNESEEGNGGEGTSLEHVDNMPTSSPSLLEMVNSVVNEGYKDQVQWIHRILLQNAANRNGQDKIFSVPIVPLTEANEMAMEDSVFTDFLQVIGISPPANEQEMFWRLPARFDSSMLKSLADGIELDEEGQLLNPETLSAIQFLKPSSSSKDSKRKERKKHQKEKKKKQENERKRKAKEQKREKRKEREERRKRRRSESEGGSDDNVHAGSDGGSDAEQGGDDDGTDERVGSKLPSATQRREALKVMLQRRRGKEGHFRPSPLEDDLAAEHNTDDQPSTPVPEESSETVAKSDEDMERSRTRISQGSKKRIKRVMESDSDSDSNGRLMIDQDRTSCHPSPTKPAKRIRLLDSDLSDEEDKENMDTSHISYKSDEVAGSQSQPQSQGLLDFGDSDCEDSNVADGKGTDGSSGSDDDLPLTDIVSRKAGGKAESFPATMLSQGPPASDDSDLDDHVPLGALKKKRAILSDDDDDNE